MYRPAKPAPTTTASSITAPFVSGDMDRHHVGAFRHEGHARITLAGHAVRDGRGEIVHALHPGQRRVGLVEAVGVEADAPDPHRAELHLGLPLVDVGVRLALDAGLEAVGAQVDETPLGVYIVLRAHALRAR